MFLLRAWQLIAVSAILCGTISAQTCDRTIQGPIVIPVRNVTVEGAHLRRGMQFQYGTPPQNIAVAVSQGFNETYLYDQSGQCSEIPTEQCSLQRGGAFDESSSSTWASLSSLSRLNSQDDVTSNTGSNGLAGNDVVTINSTLTWKNVPVAVPRIINGPDYSSFGLGHGSRILDVARNAGSIASKSWSLFWGQTGLTSDNAADGAVVLGGYDVTQTIGNNYTGSVSLTGVCRSGMIVPVTDMRVVLPDGSGGSLLSGGTQGQSINYCLETEFPMITMSDKYWNVWQEYEPYAANDGTASHRNGAPPNIWGLTYPASNASKADLKITIGNNLDITIPNHQLVQASYSFDGQGKMLVNSSIRELMINPLMGENANDIPKFGMTFFQATYLHVNYESNQFTLWQAANPKGPGKFVGVGKSTTGCPTEGNTTNSSSQGSNGSSNGNQNQQARGKSLSAGAIAGIAVGTATAVLLLAALAFMLYRRRKKHAEAHSSSDVGAPLNGYYQDKPELMGSSTIGPPNTEHNPAWYYGNNEKSELASKTTSSTKTGTVSPQEVPAIGLRRPTMTPQEMPTERYND